MSKGTMAVISLIALCSWSLGIAIYLSVNDFLFWGWLLLLWFVGTLLSSIRKIPIGCVGDVELLGFHIAIWNSGYSLIPPFFPFLLFINRYIVGINTRPEDANVGGRTRITNEESFHHKDDRFTAKRVVMKTGPLGMLSFSVFQDFFRILGNIDHPSHFRVLSFPVMFLFYILLGASALSGLTGGNSLPFQEKEGGGITVVVLLEQMPAPKFPQLEKFVRKGDHTSNIFFEESGLRYFYHPNKEDGNPPHVLGKAGACFMVIAGEEIVFETKTRPRFVVNMENRVKYTPLPNHLPWLWRTLDPPEEWKVKNLPALLLGEKASWQYLHSNWNEVDTRYNLIARAKKKSSLASKAGGGLVCF